MASLPHEQLLRARIRAFPFDSEYAFSNAMLTLSSGRSLAAQRNKQTEALFAALSRHVAAEAGCMSLNALQQFTKSVWFPEGLSEPAAEEISLGKYLRNLALLLLQPAGNATTVRCHPIDLTTGAGPKSPPQLAENARELRWLTFMLPADLLVTAACIATYPLPATEHITYCTPALSRLLEQGATETHLHFGAALAFHELWTNTMREAGTPKFLTDLPETDNAPFGDRSSLGKRLVGCAVLRVLLGSFLMRANPDYFATYTNRTWIPASVACGIRENDLKMALRCTVPRDASEGSIQTLKRTYRRLVGPRQGARCLEEMRDTDPLARLFPKSELQPETHLLARALRYLSDTPDDVSFARCFWQYQRVRVALYQFLVQRPSHGGLDWFKSHFDRLRSAKGSLDGCRVASALKLDSRVGTLRSLEVRTAPEAEWSKIRESVRDVAKAARDFVTTSGATRPECGLVFHFIKEADRNANAGRVPRHSGWFKSRKRQSISIATALKHKPELLLVLRGIDVASAELDLPTWVVAPLLRDVRCRSERAALTLRQTRPNWNIPPLSVTIHAGEEYRSIHEGLRRVHECIEMGLLRSGDRIGHGLVLGDKIEFGSYGLEKCAQPAEERLEDLLWELDRYNKGQLCPKGGRALRIKEEALSLGQHIYAKPVTETDLLAARHARFDVERWGYPRRFKDSMHNRNACSNAHSWFSNDARELYYQYMEDPSVRRRGGIPVEVACGEAELAAMAGAQQFVRQELASREITIETNPSSNLLIRRFRDIREHPMFCLSPLDRTGNESLAVTINSDDPITFATSLADEFAHVYFALIQKNVSSHDALAWLERAQASAFRARFTLPLSADVTALSEVLNRPTRCR